MRLLLDTHLLLWTSILPRMLSAEARELIDDRSNQVCFSAASIWEIAVKRGLGRSDFDVDPGTLRQGLLGRSFVEMPITSVHAVAVAALPTIHKDPFDRILLAQAVAEGLVLLTSDALLARYPGPVRRIMRAG
jgi:PIN domain nuclease of toxin-antitoxin system